MPGPGVAAWQPTRVSFSDRAMRVVTFNLHLAKRLERALEVMQSEPDLASADVISLQEADERAVELLGEALGLERAWYPAAVHPRTGRYFAPAVLSRWPIRSHQRLDLPHPGLHGLRRVAVRARVEPPGGLPFEFIAVHFGTMREILFRHQDDQARNVLAALGQVSSPMVVAGDLNRRGLGKVFEASGFHWVTRRIGWTHHVWSFDHVFTRGFASRTVKAGSVRAALRASDHRAVWAELDPS
jgi:endonuclease/exonuclease/phosphatase family metal-dependent hydrolase